MDAHALGDGGTLLVRLRSPEGQVIGFDVRSPTTDLQRRVHVHLEAFNNSRLPKSRIVERGTPEEQTYGRHLAEALAPHLQPELAQARQQRFALSRAFVNAVFRHNDAKNAEEPIASQADLKEEMYRALAASDADPVTDQDRSVRNASAILHIIETRATDPSFGVYDEFPYNIGSYGE